MKNNNIANKVDVVRVLNVGFSKFKWFGTG